MQEKTAPSSHESAGDQRLELVRNSSPAAEAGARVPSEPEDAGSHRTTVFQKLGKLKPLLPILTGGLRLVDHGAVQILAQLLNFVDTGSAAHDTAQEEELYHGLAEIQTNHRELSSQVLDQTVEIKRIEEQLARLRQSVERNATEHAALVNDVRSLGNLVRTFGAVFGVLLIVLIVLASFLLIHHG